MVLLHRLPASGDAFGGAFDGVEGQLVVPDLLGFGRSRLPAGVPVDREAHWAALDEMVTDDHRLWCPDTRWAACWPDSGQVDGVVTWCTPLLHDPDEAPRALHDKAPGLGWIGVPGRLSRTLCTQLCTRRSRVAQWLHVLLCPEAAGRGWPGSSPSAPSAPGRRTPHDERCRARRASLAVGIALEQARVPVLHAVGARDVLAPLASLVRIPAR